jgi:hypothetical protein
MSDKKSDKTPEPSSHPNPGESMNVRAVHDAIIRELPDPIELYKNVPWYLRHLYAALLIGAILYLITLAGSFDWKTFDTPLEKIGVFQE